MDTQDNKPIEQDIKPIEQDNEPLFMNINSENPVQIIESMCIVCFKQGVTRLMMTIIPFFKEVVISSFECNECHYRGSELLPAGELKSYGQHTILKIIKSSDLDRDLIKSENCSIKFNELDFEIPPSNEKGSVNTIEGYLKNAYDGMMETQEIRRQQDPQSAIKLGLFLIELKSYMDGEKFPLTLEMDDPSGNSFIKNPYAPSDDPQMKTHNYVRSLEQNHKLGLAPELEGQDMEKKQEEQDNIENNIAHRFDFNKPYTEDAKGESLQFESTCHACYKQGYVKMCTSSIPYFKEIIVMAFTCDECGAHSTEVKTGGAISEKGKKITLKVEDEDDLKRDLYKSDSAYLCIPELELELEYGTLGGVYTTVEGLVEKIHSHLKGNNPYYMGDSNQESFKSKINTFFIRLEGLRDMKEKFTIIIDDPLDNSFIQNPFYPKEDLKITTEVYERNDEQNDEFGLKHMKVDNYQEDFKKEEQKRKEEEGLRNIKEEDNE